MGAILLKLFGSPRALLFWGTLCAFVALAKGYVSVADAQARYEVARQLWYEGSLLLPENSSVASFFDEDGRGVPPYGLGQSLVMLPSVVLADGLSRLAPPERRDELAYLAGQCIYMLAFLPFISALCVLAVHTLACRLGLDRRAALWAAFAFGFGTYWFYYTRTLGQNLEVTALCLASICVYTGGDPRPRRSAGAAALLGATLLYRPEFLIPVTLTLGVFACDQWRRRTLSVSQVAALLVPVFVCGCGVLLHNHARSGNPFEVFPGSHGYFFDDAREATTGAQDAPLLADHPGRFLFASLFGPSKGLFWYSPVLLAGLLVLVPGWARGRRVLALAAVPVAGQLLFVSSLNWALYEGGWGPRYLLPITPFVVLGCAALLAPALARPRVRRALAAFVLVACTVQVVLSMEDHARPLRQNELALAHLEAHHPETALEVWHSSLLLGRLRNLSFFPLDPPALREAWRTPAVQELPPHLGDELWWWKLARKTGRAGVFALVTLGLALASAGVACLALALLGRPARASAATKHRRGALAAPAAATLERGVVVAAEE